jgi:hypothetical protein
LLSGLMGPVMVVVPLVFGEDLLGMCLVEHQNVVADLVAEGSDDPFDLPQSNRISNRSRPIRTPGDGQP